jgi:hypothetical protein
MHRSQNREHEHAKRSQGRKSATPTPCRTPCRSDALRLATSRTHPARFRTALRAARSAGGHAPKRYLRKKEPGLPKMCSQGYPPKHTAFVDRPSRPDFNSKCTGFFTGYPPVLHSPSTGLSPGSPVIASQRVTRTRDRRQAPRSHPDLFCYRPRVAGIDAEQGVGIH